MGRLIRVLVANQPILMREAMLGIFACQPDVEILGEASGYAEICERVNQTLPDVLVVTMDDSEKRPAICNTVLHAHPNTRVIAVSSRKNRGACYWATLQIHSKNVEPSKEGMLLAVRGRGLRECS